MSDPTSEEGVVEANFVRKEWYVEPPAKGAPPEVWAAWLEADRKAAIAAKRAFTKAQKYAEAPESARATVTAKIGGVWKQTALVGFTGDAESNTLAIEAAVDADQERSIVLARQLGEAAPRGTVSKGRSARQRQAKRAARARRFGSGNH